jgi:tRNA-Thr(GGU) m(6)t(6)A37 methyltransferase TsaA
MEYRLEPVGVIHSCFKEKFGIPRQPGLVPEARATLELLPPYDRDEAVRGLEGFSHIWVVFVFHATAGQGWSPTVRPPRLGGNERVGVFATRSTFRPNPVGLSVVALEGIGREEGRLLLYLSGVDLLDGTPVLDIKPYLPYADSLPHAVGGFAQDAPARMAVRFADEVASALQEEEERYPGLRALIEQLVALNPSPGYHAEHDRRYGMRLHDLDIRWQLTEDSAVIVAVRRDCTQGQP